MNKIIVKGREIGLEDIIWQLIAIERGEAVRRTTWKQ